ncbi:MAG: histidine phosphatase family protein [Kiritimatiellae bacterium]|nr:histidine phosphatase family protein [Kiritimatiellia bacterium]MBQ6925401.1 histidine phosphatase family protein [Kiritimatiellia bacterium]
MHLVFIRHGEPDYSVDSLTPEGFREAEALAARVAGWKGRVTACYCSPLGRARRTSEPSLAALGMEAETLPWMEEFAIRTHDRPDGTRHCVTWDLLPAWRTEQPQLAEPEGWVRAEPYPASEAQVLPRWEQIKAGVDGVLARHGYVRERGIYRAAPDARRDGLLVFFCHHGLACAAIGHVLGIAPPQLWDGYFLPPASVTVLNSEERVPGIAAFRCQCMGDTSHLREAGLPVSRSGSYGDVFPL